MINKDDIVGFTLVEMIFLILLVFIGLNIFSDKDKIIASQKTKITDLEDEIKRLRERGINIFYLKAQKILDDIYKEINGKLNQFDLKAEKNDDKLEIIIKGSSNPITFDTAKYDLFPDDERRLINFILYIEPIIKDKPVIIVINGQADPRPYERKSPPRDNTELSALRSATVSSLLEKTASGIGNKIHVVGLGSKHDVITKKNIASLGKEFLGIKETDISSENMDKVIDGIYKEYRSVILSIRVNIDYLIREESIKKIPQ